MRVKNSAGKGTSGIDKFGSIIDRMNMKIGNSLRLKIQLLKGLQRVIVVDYATHSQKDGVEGNGGSLKDLKEGRPPYFDGPRERNSKSLTYHHWCTLPARRALVTLFLTVSRCHLQCGSFRHRVHTLRYETAT